MTKHISDRPWAAMLMHWQLLDRFMIWMGPVSRLDRSRDWSIVQLSVVGPTVSR